MMKLKIFFFLFLVVFISGCFFSVNLPSGRYVPLEEVTVLGEGKDKILLVNISGVISWEDIRGGRGLFSYSEPSIVSRIKEELEKASKDDNVKAVVFKVSSPGGLVSASEAIYSEIKNFKEKKKVPIVAFISTLGVSGSYYVITPSDVIIAAPGSTVGSIGVYLMKLNVEKLSEKVGVEFEVIKGGTHKDMLSFHRKMTEEERAKIQKLIDYYFSLFKSRVAEWRGNKLKKSLDEIADGSVFSPEESLSLGLIDKVGDIYSAINDAAKLAGLKENWKVVAYVRKGESLPTIWADTYGSQDMNIILRKILPSGEFMILYLWPGEM
jgi:protease-4